MGINFLILIKRNVSVCDPPPPPFPDEKKRISAGFLLFEYVKVIENEFKEDVFDVSHWSIIMRPVPIL